MEARAVVAVRPWAVEFQSVAVPEPGPEDVVLRVQHSWISNGTEGSFIRGERIAGDTPRKESDPLPFPHVPGYQKTGVLEWVGPKVEGLAVGDQVFASVSRVEGMFYSSGGHVSPAVTSASQVWKLPDGVSPVSASGLVLTQVGYNVGMRPALERGEAVVVLGDGLVGHWTAQTLRHRGGRVMMVGRHDERLSRFDPGEGGCRVRLPEGDLLACVKAWAPEGVQAVADTVGSIPTLTSLIPAMRRGGQISSAGFYGPNGLIDIQALRDRELSLHAPSGWSRERVRETLDLLARDALQTERLITHRFPVERATEAYGLILSRPSPALGVILDWE